MKGFIKGSRVNYDDNVIVMTLYTIIHEFIKTAACETFLKQHKSTDGYQILIRRVMSKPTVIELVTVVHPR